MSRRRTIESIENSEVISIGELVRLSGVRYSSLKYYTEENLLEYEQEDSNLTRRYNRIATLDRINEIKKLRNEGRTISEIKKMICNS